VLASVSAGCLLVGFGVWWLRWGPDRDLQRWRRGAAGERATAAVLAELTARRWAVLHDRRVPGSRANLDHLVIGPSGVWLLDTKTTRAVVRARWRRVHFGKRCLDAGPTKWEAQVVADRLGVAVRPLIVVHGSGLRGRGGRCGGVRVVPPGHLVRCLRRPWHRRRLSNRDAAQLAAEAEGAFPPAGRSLEKGVTVRG
jgi:Nuclease-related domain